MSRFARLVEKDIFEGFATDDNGTSEIVDLSGADKFSAQAIYTVDSPVGASVTFQGSNNRDSDAIWTNLQAATVISGDGTVMIEKANCEFRYFRAVKGLTSGDVDLKCLTLVIGDAI